MLNPGQAEPGGLGNLIARQPSQGATPTGINPVTPMLSQMPVQQLMAELLNPNSTTPKFAVLSAIQKAQERMRMSQAMQGMAAQQAVAQQPGTVAQEILAAGIGSQPYEFAGGGLVAFADGGMAEDPPLTLGDIEAADLGDQMAFGFGSADPVAEAEALAADEARVAAAREERRRAEIRERYNYLKLPGVAPEAAAQLLAENPWLERTQVGAPTPTARPAATAAPVAGAAPAPRPAPAAGTARPGAGAGAGRPAAAARPGAGVAATPDDIAQYTAAAQAAIAGMQGRGVPGAEELELRKALLAAQEAERLPSMEYKEPSGLTGRELLQLASFDPTKGKWMGSLAEKAAGVMGAREAKAEEARKANREIDIANRRLNTALAQQRLAYASGDRKAKEDADVAVANARVALRENLIKFGLESRKVGAQERQAGAAEVAALQRGETRQELSPRDRANLRDKATDNVTKNPQTVVVVTRAKAEAQRRGVPFDEQAFREQLVEREYQALLAAAEGRTAAPVPAATGATLSAEDRALIDKYK